MTNNVVKKPDSAAVRNAIFRLEEAILELPDSGLEECGIETVHRFGAGTYCREMIVPAGRLITGYVHKTEHISIFLEGSMIVAGPDGESVEIEAPIVEIGQPGIKRAGITQTRVRWLTVHATDETNIEKLEQMLLTNDPKEAQVIADQQDYLLVQEPPDLLKLLREIEVHDIEADGVEIRDSQRHGKGVFATKGFSAGERVAPGILGGDLTCWSRYMNHSADSNVVPVWEGNDAYFVAIKDIDDEEVTIDYRTTLGEQE